MPITNDSRIEVVRFDTWDDFLKDVQQRGIRLVKLADYGFAEPEHQGQAIVLQPKVKIVATAFDKGRSQILRWEESRKAKETIVFSGSGEMASHTDAAIKSKKEHLKSLAELEGLAVSDGEWTPKKVEALLLSA